MRRLLRLVSSFTSSNNGGNSSGGGKFRAPSVSAAQRAALEMLKAIPDALHQDDPALAEMIGTVIALLRRFGDKKWDRWTERWGKEVSAALEEVAAHPAAGGASVAAAADAAGSADELARADAEAVAAAAVVEKARAETASREVARAEAKVKAEAEVRAKAKAEAEAEAKAKAEAETEAKAKAEAEAEAKAKAKGVARAEAAAKAEAAARAKAESEAAAAAAAKPETDATGVETVGEELAQLRQELKHAQGTLRSAYQLSGEARRAFMRGEAEEQRRVVSELHSQLEAYFDS